MKLFKSFEIRDTPHYDAIKKEKTIELYLFTNMIYRLRQGLYNKDRQI